MKILQVIPYFAPAWAYGGPCRIAFDLTRYLASKGHEVTVYTTDANDEHSRLAVDAKFADFAVERFANLSNYLAWRHRIFLSIGTRSAVVNTLDSYDVVHLHEYRSYQNLVVERVARTRSVPIVIQAHGSLPLSVGQGSWKKLHDAIFGEKLIDLVSGAIALNANEEEAYMRLGVPKTRVELVPNAVDADLREAVGPEEEFREEFAIGQDVRLVTYLGRLHESKGIHLLVEAISKVAKFENRFLVLLAGPDDGMRRRLKDMVVKRGLSSVVRFLGTIGEKVRLSALANSDLLVVPTFTGFPVTLLESYMVGTPVITTLRSDKLDWLNDDVARIVPFDAESLANIIIDLLGDPKTRNDLGSRGRRMVSERFTWPTVGKMYEDLYRKAVRDPRGLSGKID